MATRKFSCSAIGNQVNEDYVAVGSTYAVLLDGASGITGTRVLPHHSGSDAQWFSHFVGGRICEYLDMSRGIVDSIRLAVDDSRDFIGKHGVTDNEELFPSSTLVVVSVSGDLVDIVSLGDSPAFIGFKDGSLVTMSDERIAERRLASRLMSSLSVYASRKIWTLTSIVIRGLSCTMTHRVLCCGCRGKPSLLVDG